MAQVRRNAIIVNQENSHLARKNAVAAPAGVKRSALVEISSNITRKNVIGAKEPVAKVPVTKGKEEPTVQKKNCIVLRPRPPLRKAESTVNISKEPIEDIDKRDKDDPFLVTEYVNDIYNYLRDLEIKYPIKKDFLTGQEVTPKMRAILVDWLIEVHQQFHLLLETLYLSVSIIDRYLQEVKNVSRKNLQLVGAAAMYVASKFEEMYAPEVSDFTYICDNAYSKEQILRMEAHIVQTLKFSFSRPLPIRFLRRYGKAAHAMMQNHMMAKYLMELTLVEYTLCHFPPSKIAAAAMYLGIWLFSKDKKRVWTSTLVHYSTYSYEDIKPVVKALASLAFKASTAKYQAVNKKYAQSKFLKVSCMPELHSDELQTLASAAS